MSGAVLHLQGVGDVLVAEDGERDDEGRPLTDARGRASLAVRPMVTWHGLVRGRMTLQGGEDGGLFAGEFVATSPPAGRACTLRVELTPTSGARCVHLVVLSLPSGVPLGGADVRCVNDHDLAVEATDGPTRGVSDANGRVVFVWPEGALLWVDAAGHTARAINWEHVRPPSAPWLHADAESALRGRAVPLELAAHGRLVGQLDPAWANPGDVRASGLTTIGSASTNRVQLVGAVDASGAWAIDGVPTVLPANAARVLCDDGSAARPFNLHWSSFQNGFHGVHIAQAVALAPGETRILDAPALTFAPLELAVRIDGLSAPPGTSVHFTTTPTPQPRGDGRDGPDERAGALLERWWQQTHVAVGTVNESGRIRFKQFPVLRYSLSYTLPRDDQTAPSFLMLQTVQAGEWEHTAPVPGADARVGELWLVTEPQTTSSALRAK